MNQPENSHPNLSLKFSSTSQLTNPNTFRKNNLILNKIRYQITKWLILALFSALFFLLLNLLVFKYFNINALKNYRTCNNSCFEELKAKSSPDFSLSGFATQNGGTSGGNDGTKVKVNSLQELIIYAKSDKPYIIEINETISGGINGSTVSVNSNKTIIGIGSKAFLQGVGLLIKGQTNVIIRNIKFTMSTITKTSVNDEGRHQVDENDGDCIGIVSSSNIWIDHNELYSIDPKKQTNQDLYDGLIDVKKDSKFITISWNYFHDHHKVSLIGSSDRDNFDRRITFHHNLFRNVKERTPSYRFGTGHIYNNYFHHILSSAVNSRMNACLRIENNYFEDTKNPIIAKKSINNGFWQVFGNVFINGHGNIPKSSTCDAKIRYSYEMDNGEDVKLIVSQNAGIGKI